MIDVNQLARILPLSSAARRNDCIDGIVLTIMQCHAGETINRTAGLLATIDAETGSLKWMTEIGDAKYFARYDGRMGNGPGDGYRYRGRGFIMLTGRANYEAAGKAMRDDLLAHPGLAAAQYRAPIMAWFWNAHNINASCDRGDWASVRKAVNGGTNGMETFLATVKRAQAVLEA